MLRAPHNKILVAILLVSVLVVPLTVSASVSPDGATSTNGETSQSSSQPASIEGNVGQSDSKSVSSAGGLSLSNATSASGDGEVVLSESDSVSREGETIVLNASQSSGNGDEDGYEYDSGEIESGWEITQYETQWLWSGDPDTGEGISQPSVFGYNSDNLMDWESARWQAAQDTDVVHPVPPHVIIKWNDQSWEEFSWDGRDNWIFDGLARRAAPPSRDKSMGPSDGNPVNGDDGEIRQAQTNAFAISPGTYYRTGNGGELHVRPEGTAYVLTDFQTDLPLATATTDEDELPENAVRRETYNVITRTWVSHQYLQTGDGDMLAKQTHGINADGWPRRHDELNYDMNSDRYDSGDVDPEDVDELEVESKIQVDYVRLTATTYEEENDDGETVRDTVYDPDPGHSEVTVEDTYDVEVNTVESDDFEVMSLTDHTTREGTGRLGVFATNEEVDWAGYRVPDASREEDVLRSVPAYGEVTANLLAPRREVTTNWAFLTARDKNWDDLEIQKDVARDSEEPDQEVEEFSSDSRPLYVHAFRGNRPRGATLGVNAGRPPRVGEVYYEPEEWARNDTPENFAYRMVDQYQDRRVNGITATHYVTDVSDTDIEIYGTVSGQETEIENDEIEERHRYESNLTMEVDHRLEESRIRINLKNEQTGNQIGLNPGNDRYDSTENVEQQHGEIVLRHAATNDVLGTFQPSDGTVAVTVNRTGAFTAIYNPAPWTSAKTSFTPDRVRVAGSLPLAMELFEWFTVTFIALLPVIYVLYQSKKFERLVRHSP